jgi:WD40 repeat protein
VSAFAALGDDEFVVCAYRDLIFYSHCYGRDVARLHEIKNAHDEMIHCVAACSDRFVTGSSDGTVAVWSTDTQEKLAVISGHTIVDFVRIDEWHIVNTMTNRAVYVHDAKTLEFFHDLLDNPTQVQSFALVGEGHILTAEEGYHGKFGTFIRLAALPSGEEIARINFPARVYSVDVSPGGWIVAASHLGVFLFPPPPVVALIGIFRERTAAARRASCARIVGLALAVADRMR